MSIVAGPHPRDLSSLPNDGTDWLAAPEAGIAALRVAWTPDWGYAAVDPEVLSITEAAVRRLSAAGAPIDVAAPRFPDPSAAWDALFSTYLAARLEGYLPEWRTRMDAGLVRYLEKGQRTGGIEFVQAGNVRRTLNEAFAEFFRTYHLLLTPTLAAPPLPIERQAYEEIGGKRVGPLGWFVFTFPINMIGYPAATVPAGWTGSGLPVGLQIIGPRFADALVLRAAAAFEAVQPWADRRPPLETHGS
jgi:aspartyl-tRNA(Asn)/glutamyl-tRNA(Gln) amidotransferase subunit A